jgi:hypothetical protein
LSTSLEDGPASADGGEGVVWDDENGIGLEWESGVTREEAEGNSTSLPSVRVWMSL